MLNNNTVRVVLILAALILAVLDLLQSSGKSKLGWAVLILVLLVLLPMIS